jgi:hypothetical protein
MLRHFCGIVGFVSLCCVCGAAAYGQYDDASADAPATPPESATSPTDDQDNQRAREGTQLLRQLGRFTTTGDRLTFHIAGSEQQYLGLENLALERIGKVLIDRRDQASELQWEVTGVFTEYRGTNYLLVTRALLKTKNARGSTAITSSAR